MARPPPQPPPRDLLLGQPLPSHLIPTQLKILMKKNSDSNSSEILSPRETPPGHPCMFKLTAGNQPLIAWRPQCPAGTEHSSTHTPPPAQPTGGSPQVDTLIVLAGTIQELRGSVPPVSGWQVVRAKSPVCQEAACARRSPWPPHQLLEHCLDRRSRSISSPGGGSGPGHCLVLPGNWSSIPGGHLVHVEAAAIWGKGPRPGQSLLS